MSDPVAGAAGTATDDPSAVQGRQPAVPAAADHRHAADDPHGWGALVRMHGPAVFRLAMRLTGSRVDAEDLSQEVFVRAMRSMPQMPDAAVATWLRRVAVNLYVDGYRRRQRYRIDPVGEVSDRALVPAMSAESAFEAATLDHDVTAALAAINPDFRQAVMLCDVEGMSYEEIADRLGVSMGTVRSRIHRGRAALRRMLPNRAPRRAPAGRPALV